MSAITSPAARRWLRYRFSALLLLQHDYYQKRYIAQAGTYTSSEHLRLPPSWRQLASRGLCPPWWAAITTSKVSMERVNCHMQDDTDIATTCSPHQSYRRLLLSPNVCLLQLIMPCSTHAPRVSLVTSHLSAPARHLLTSVQSLSKSQQLYGHPSRRKTALLAITMSRSCSTFTCSAIPRTLDRLNA